MDLDFVFKVYRSARRELLDIFPRFGFWFFPFVFALRIIAHSRWMDRWTIIIHIVRWEFEDRRRLADLISSRNVERQAANLAPWHHFSHFHPR